MSRPPNRVEKTGAKLLEPSQMFDRQVCVRCAADVTELQTHTYSQCVILTSETGRLPPLVHELFRLTNS